MQVLNYPHNLYLSPQTPFTPQPKEPKIDKDSFIHPYACIIGDVTISKGVDVCPSASIRGDEGTPIFIGENSNIQDGVVIHGVANQFVENKNQKYSVYIGKDSSLAHQSQVHGPSKVGDNVFIGMQSFIYHAEIGDNVVVEPASKIINVKIAPNKYVPAGGVIKTQEQADKLPDITADYPNKDFNKVVTSANQALTIGYKSLYN